MRFTVTSATSAEILEGLTNLSIDAGLTYLDNEAIGGVKSVPLYRETYCLLTGADSNLGRRKSVGWRDLADPTALPDDAGHAEPPHRRPDAARRRRPERGAAGIQLCPDASSPCRGRLLVEHRAGQPSPKASAYRPEIAAVPIGEPEVSHLIGLVVAPRYAISPLTNALVQEAERLAVQVLPPNIRPNGGWLDRFVLSQQTVRGS